jgi:hypothetical protein
MRLQGEVEIRRRVLNIAFMTVSVCSQLHYISSCFDGREEVRAATLRGEERDANRLLGDVEKPEVSIADPWDPPEGFITFGSIFSASRAIAYTVNYCKGTWSLWWDLRNIDSVALYRYTSVSETRTTRMS